MSIIQHPSDETLKFVRTRSCDFLRPIKSMSPARRSPEPFNNDLPRPQTDVNASSSFLPGPFLPSTSFGIVFDAVVPPERLPSSIARFTVTMVHRKVSRRLMIRLIRQVTKVLALPLSSCVLRPSNFQTVFGRGRSVPSHQFSSTSAFGWPRNADSTVIAQNFDPHL